MHKTYHVALQWSQSTRWGSVWCIVSFSSFPTITNHLTTMSLLYKKYPTGNNMSKWHIPIKMTAYVSQCCLLRFRFRWSTWTSVWISFIIETKYCCCPVKDNIISENVRFIRNERISLTFTKNYKSKCLTNNYELNLPWSWYGLSWVLESFTIVIKFISMFKTEIFLTFITVERN